MATLNGVTMDVNGRFFVAGDSTTYFNLQSAITERDRQQRRIYQPSSRPAPAQKRVYKDYDSKREQDMGRRSTKRKRVYNSLQASTYSLESTGCESVNIANDNRILRARWSTRNDSPANEDRT